MYAETLTLDTPQWSGAVRRRLHRSLLLSAAGIAAILLVLRFPAAEPTGTVTELLVRILIDDVESIIDPSLTPQPVEEPVAEPAAPPVQVPLAPTDTAAQPPPAKRSIDWYALLPDAARAAADRAARPESANPAFDERRRQAALQFRPSKAPRVPPIWENVEQDALGRSVLWSGDCYRVIDDPNAGSREAFETFGQYLVSCIGKTRQPQELSFVKEIRSRRAVPVRSSPPAAE